MATHSSILTWRISWTEEPGRLQPIGLRRVRHDWRRLSMHVHRNTVGLPWWLSQFSHSVVSDSLQPYGLQHARLPCPSPTPGADSISCLSSWWCYPTISSSVIRFSSLLQSFPTLVFSNDSVLCFRWPKYYSFSISPSNEYSGLISFRIHWFDLLALQGTLKVFSSTIVQKQFFSTQLSL